MKIFNVFRSKGISDYLPSESDLKDIQTFELVELVIVSIGFSRYEYLANKLSPIELAEIVCNFSKTVTEDVYRYEGVVLSSISNITHAAWGISQNGTNKLEHALAATEIFSNYDLGKIDERLVGVDILVGISCGSAAVGNLGGNQRYQYGVIGKPFDRASHLRELNKSLGTKTLLDLGTSLDCHVGNYFYIGQIKLPHEIEPIKTYTLEKDIDDSERNRVLDAVEKLS